MLRLAHGARPAPRQLLCLAVLGLGLIAACRRQLPTEVRAETHTTKSAIATACPVVSCLTETGYADCKRAGCACDPRTDACVPPVVPPPPPMCPNVSCLTQGGYDECKAAGCGCHPRTDLCVASALPPTSDVGTGETGL